MLVEGIKSRPVYGRLMPAAGSEHVIVLDGDGPAACLDMARQADGAFFPAARIILIGDACAAAAGIAALGPHALHERPSIPSALPLVRRLLEGATMTTRLYLAGTEPMMGEMIRLAEEAGLDYGAVQTEHRGSLVRWVQCVHCKGITEDVRTQPVRCAHCGLTLLVRDHYSRRIGAFQGVCIDAEEPGTAPAPKEVFP